jgi:hypothetical protein
MISIGQDDTPAVVLDAGAARGAVVQWLEEVQQLKRITAFGIDISAVAVRSGHSRWPLLLDGNKLVQVV